ncbi:MAG: type II 3-dehydroquinate dehydratase [Bacteroides sp.]|nr:type II 3-dehydroquinate dehydratase [Bacteroides sp.]MBD5297395.1 type II 3-dehydroquinate dehydratase [Bacteroides sp.]MBD5321040.1 type II 3-dehydroquinate dehydratase [Bacteroides sp.]MBD5350944.1 type II 3-dehydroquinate dehydratase [Bacteroides sp.]MBD5421923.1 type II 3-dehydroquinate dehydratase [Bacteroides sp.]
MKLQIINGPNLNLLGMRQPEIYGAQSMEQYLESLAGAYPDIDFDYYQSNHEGDIIDAIQRIGYLTDEYCGIILNAGAYTHTSLAIADAIAAVPMPVVEVHISNIAARETVRHHSMIAAVCRGTIAGFGMDSYRLAVEALI